MVKGGEGVLLGWAGQDLVWPPLAMGPSPLHLLGWCGQDWTWDYQISPLGEIFYLFCLGKKPGFSVQA